MCGTISTKNFAPIINDGRKDLWRFMHHFDSRQLIMYSSFKYESISDGTKVPIQIRNDNYGVPVVHIITAIV